MQSSRNLKEKSYEQLIAEAIAQIPLYDREWTNFNRSDPGITILENLAAFHALQQEELGRVPEAVKQKLLELAGFYSAAGRAAVAYLLPTEENGSLPEYAMGQKLYAQDICYELPPGTAFLTTGILGFRMARTEDGQWEMRIVLDGFLPEEIYFYVKLSEDEKRTPFREDCADSTEQTKWRLLTDTGKYRLKAADGTHQFRNSGIVHLTAPKEVLGHCEICGTTGIYKDKAAPRIDGVRGLLTPVVQRDTKSVVIARDKAERIVIGHELLKAGYVEVYGKEADGTYRLYRVCDEADKADGAYCCVCRKKTEYEMEFLFSQKSACHSIEGETDGILVVIRETSMLPYRRLGRLYGYDNQEFLLPPLARVDAERLSFFVMWEEKEGSVFVQWVRDGASADGELRYRLNEREQTLTVEECGIYEGAVLLIGDYCLCRYAAGNVLSGTKLRLERGGKTAVFVSMPGGIRGRDPEDFEDVRKRFAADLKKPATIVTAEDCEKLVREIPGLSIHKVKAIADAAKNRIYVMIKPNGKEKSPGLSAYEQRAVRVYLEERRMLTARIVLEQPQYAAIHIRGVLAVKKQFAGGIGQAEGMLRQKLDGICSRMNFGETLHYYEIYQETERMDCVERIYELSVWTDDTALAQTRELDICLKRNVLCYAGDIILEEEAGGYGIR